ncbi:MAG: FkbM family methyltransferase [Candidatus Schekmanbacteria bacterium]|nr:FkbM family methyltransferase [Candidatus Schekmanbacteria bacterium]
MQNLFTKLHSNYIAKLTTVSVKASYKVPFVKRLPLTKINITIGKILYRLVTIFLRDRQRTITRNDIKYHIDLTEGIDLSLFVFGKFQEHTYNNRVLQLPDNSTVLDIGANCGIMSLHYAKLAGLGRVYSFEPTHYAFSKLKKNLTLNPKLSKRIIPVQSFVSSMRSDAPVIKAYASWKVDNSGNGDRHPVHWGIEKPSDGVKAVTIDDFCKEQNIRSIDFIKIDTDGHEMEVLKGSRKIISKCRPTILFELGVFMMEERELNFFSYYDFFRSLDYRLFNNTKTKEITIHNHFKYIPLKGGTDILAIPNEKAQ